jgi:hypothetical protein
MQKNSSPEIIKIFVDPIFDPMTFALGFHVPCAVVLGSDVLYVKTRSYISRNQPIEPIEIVIIDKRIFNINETSINRGNLTFYLMKNNHPVKTCIIVHNKSFY